MSSDVQERKDTDKCFTKEFDVERPSRIVVKAVGAAIINMEVIPLVSVAAETAERQAKPNSLAIAKLVFEGRNFLIQPCNFFFERFRQRVNRIVQVPVHGLSLRAHPTSIIVLKAASDVVDVSLHYGTPFFESVV